MDEYLAAQFRQVLRKLPIRSLKEAYRNLTEHKTTGISILDKHSHDDARRAVDEVLRERGQVPPGELKHVPMTDDGCKAIAYELLENPQFWFNTDRMKKLTGLVYWSQVYKVLDVLQDKYFIAQARQRYKEMGASDTAKIALKNIGEISRVMRFTWEDHVVPQIVKTERGGDGDFGVPIWFRQAGNNWVKWSEAISEDKVVTVNVAPVKGMKRSVLESAFSPSQAQIVNFFPDEDLPYAGAKKGTLWFMATIGGKAVKVTITSIRGLTERQLEDAFNGATARITMGAPETRPRQQLLTEEIRKKLPLLGATENIKDPIVQVKFFTPWTNWTWYATEFDGQDTFFGWVVGFEKELGYFSLSELEKVRGPMGLYIERDMYFEPKPLSKVMAEYGSSLPMTIPKETRHRVFRVSDGKLMFKGNKIDALREFERLGGSKAGYQLWYTMSETMPWLDVIDGKLVMRYGR